MKRIEKEIQTSGTEHKPTQHCTEQKRERAMQTKCVAREENENKNFFKLRAKQNKKNNTQN